MYVCAQVHKAFRPPLACLFIAGAVFQCMRVKTCVWGGGAGKVSRCVLPFEHSAGTSGAMCSAATSPSWSPLSLQALWRFVQWTQMFQVIIYSRLYLIHIHAACENAGMKASHSQDVYYPKCLLSGFMVRCVHSNIPT